MSNPSDAPKPDTPKPASDAPETDAAEIEASAAEAVQPKPEDQTPNSAGDEGAEATNGASEGVDNDALAEPSGWGQSTIAALRTALGGGKNADAVADEITKLVEENADIKDRMLRLAADMENLRKRTEREKADTAKYAVSKFAEDMLRVGDNLGRALESVPADAEDKDAALKSLRDGIEMTSTELLNGLQKHGVVKEEPKGEAFDPNRHQAIAEIEDADTAAGMIAEVFQAGYMISDRVLRPAMVVVSKGPAKTAPTEPDVAPAANDDTPVTEESTGATDAEPGEG